MASDFSTITLEAITSQIIKYMGKIKTFYLVNFSKKFTFHNTLSQVVLHQNKRINQWKVRHGM